MEELAALKFSQLTWQLNTPIQKVTFYVLTLIMKFGFRQSLVPTTTNRDIPFRKEQGVAA